MTSLVLEGGSLRGIFTAGVLDAFLENDIEFDYVIGVSAGISNAASYISKQKGRNMEILRRYRNDARYVGLNNIIKDRSIFGIDFVFKQIPHELLPFDYETFKAFPGKFLAGATNAHTGEIEYFECSKLEDPTAPFIATCSIPGMFPPVKINDEFYFDGGVSDSIPILKAIEDGNKKHVIILTQPLHFQKKLDSKTKLIMKGLKRKYPKISFRLSRRHLVYNEIIKFIHKLEDLNHAIVLQPSFAIDSMEKDINKLEAAYFEGKKVAYENMSKIKAFMKE